MQDHVTKGLSDFMSGSHKHCGTGEVLKEFVSSIMVAMEMGKKDYFSYHSSSCKEDKLLHQKHELLYSNYHWMCRWQQKIETGNVNVCMYVRLTFPDIKYLFGASKIRDF